MPHRRRAVVLIMVIAILATLAVAGTAFVVVMSQEDRAAASTLYLAQAELAARSGLEHAIAVIDASMTKLEPDGATPSEWLAATPDGVLVRATGGFVADETFDDAALDAGWHRFFEPTATQVTSGEYQLLSDRARWVSHYFVDTSLPFDGPNEELYGATTPLEHEMRGRPLYIYWDNPAPPPARIKRGEYAVCVADLDGKLHANLARWTNDVGGDGAATPAPVVQAALVGAVAGVEGAGLPDAERDALIDSSGPSDQECCSISEIARRAGVTTTQRKYALERFFTAYPVASLEVPGEFTADACAAGAVAGTTDVTFSPDWTLADLLAKGYVVRFEQPGVACFTVVEKTGHTQVTVVGDCTPWQGQPFRVLPSRPAVNVNTAPQALLAELLKPIPSFAVAVDPDGDDKAEALARLICERRPFADRHELEDAIFRVVGHQEENLALIPWPDNGAIEELKDSAGGNVPNLTERQFNDILNSIAGQLDLTDSAFDEPTNPGVYSFDGWEPYQDGVGPSQTLGACSDRNGADSDTTSQLPENVSWSTELKFDSRFFHIYVIGRGWHETTAEPVGVKRLHAIYDAKPGPGLQGKVIWLRWNLSSRGSLTDM